MTLKELKKILKKKHDFKELEPSQEEVLSYAFAEIMKHYKKKMGNIKDDKEVLLMEFIDHADARSWSGASLDEGDINEFLEYENS